MNAPTVITSSTVTNGIVGLVLGFVSGFAIKKVSLSFLFAVGLLFVAIQLLAYFGYLEVNWLRIQQDLQALLTQPAIRALLDKLFTVLQFDLPFGAGFVMGFWYGFRKG